ncbi:MAG: hydroxyacylglutathione hydrolase [Crocinitomicaceae bacterium]|jgi:hydroxyacylglutathione hydrolase
MALSVEKFTFNGFQENTYIVHDGADCVIIDPGCYERSEQEELSSFISENNLSPLAVLLTHAHIDHVLGLAYVLNTYSLDFYQHELDVQTLESVSEYAHVYGFTGYIPAPSQATHLLKGGESISLGAINFDVKFTPGHAPGHVVFYNREEGFVINGDVLFQGSFGRYDLPGGDLNVLKNSIVTEMFELPEETVVYCGHGPETTIAHEKRTNPIMTYSE